MPAAIATSLLLVAYLFGSLPTGYLAGRWLKGIDIREHGSGSTGATNVLRTLGIPAGTVVLAVDMGKGALAVYLTQAIATAAGTSAPALPWLTVAAALAAVVGHSRSVWLGFKGGKSVATSLGALLVLSPAVSLGGLLAFVLTLALSRIVSLGSIAGALTVNALAWGLGLPLPYLLFAGLAGGYVLLRHRTNIERLLAGTEPRLGQKVQL